MKRTILLFIFCFSIFSTKAFQGSTPEADQTKRNWHFQDKSTAAFGSLFMIKEGKAYIETKSEVISIQISNLCWDDQQYIKEFKQKSTRDIQTEVSAFNSSSSSFTLNQKVMFPILLSVVIGIALFYSRKNKHKAYPMHK